MTRKPYELLGDVHTVGIQCRLLHNACFIVRDFLELRQNIREMRTVVRHDLRCDLLHLCTLLLKPCKPLLKIACDICPLGKPHRIECRECLCRRIQKHRACARDIRLLTHGDHAIILCCHPHAIIQRCIHRAGDLSERRIVRTRQPLVDVDIVLLFTAVLEVHIDIKLAAGNTRADEVAQVILPRTERARHMRCNLKKPLIDRLDLNRDTVVRRLRRARTVARHAPAQYTHSLPCHTPVKTGSAGPVIRICPSSRHST